VRLPHSNDSRLLLAGVVASLALVAYLAVAFANTHASNGPAPSVNKVAPWTPYHSELIPIRLRLRGKNRGYIVRVNPTKTGDYGGLIPTLAADPASGRTYAVELWLKGSRGGPVGVEIDEFSPGATSVYVVDTTVTLSPRWHRFRFKVPVKGTWLGLGMYVHRQSDVAARTWFAVRGLAVTVAPAER
jgi:hypothetical protein